MELIPDVFFCLQVDGPITGGACKRLGLSVAVYGFYVFIGIIRGSEALPKPCLLLGL